jgi:hypothetical protein
MDNEWQQGIKASVRARASMGGKAGAQREIVMGEQ